MSKINDRLHPAAICAVALGSAICLPSFAQSSVTASGVADAAMRHVANQGVGSVNSQVSGSNSTSRIAFRGVEDLGDGLAAGFHLESGVLLDAGNSVSQTQFWDRRSTVSLLSRSLGEIRAGRDFVPSYVNWSRYDPFSYVGVAGANNLISAAQLGAIRSAFGSAPNTTVRSSNSIQYLLPAGIGGIEGGVMVAFDEGGIAANGLHKVTGARLGYAGASWGVSAAHTRTENDLTVAGSLKDSAIGGYLTVGSLKLSAAYREFKYSQARQNNLLVGAVLPVGDRGEVKVSVNRADLGGRVGTAVIGANDALQLGAGYVHSLSKRTALYATWSRIDNKGAATFVVPGGPTGIAGGKTSTGYEAGMRHNF